MEKKLSNKKEEKTLLLEIHDTSKLFKEYLRRSGEEAGINSTYHRIMGAIDFYGSVSQVDLVNITHLKAPTISLTLKNMERDGLIKKESDPEDARAVKISFTALGSEICKKCVEFIKLKEKEMENIITNEEREVVLRVLKKLQNEIEKKNENI